MNRGSEVTWEPEKEILIRQTHDLVPGIKVQSYDARVGAEMGYLEQVITSPNADWVPQYPLIEEPGILKRADGLWGGHEYTRWPQIFSKISIHHTCIPFKKMPVRDVPTCDYIPWYDPEQKRDFADTGVRDTRTGSEIGQLRLSVLEPLGARLHLAAAKVNDIGPKRGNDESLKVFKRCYGAGKSALDRLRAEKASWRTIIFTVRDIQRAILELEGLYTYLKSVGPRINSTESFKTEVLSVRGTFTTESSVAEHLYRVGIPVWQIRHYRMLSDQVKVFRVVECIPWSESIEKKYVYYWDSDDGKAKILNVGFNLQSVPRLLDMASNQLMSDRNMYELLEQMYGFEKYRPGASVITSSSTSATTSPLIASSSSSSTAVGHVTSSASASESTSTPRETKPGTKRKAEKKPGPKRKAEKEAGSSRNLAKKLSVNYAAFLYVPDGVDGRPDLPAYRREVHDSLKRLGTVPENRSVAALYPLPPPFLLIHSSPERSADLYLNYIRIRPVLIDMLTNSSLFDKRVWRKLRDWRTILHGDCRKSTPLPPNTASPFIENIYKYLPPTSNTDSFISSGLSVTRGREQTDTSHLPPAKRQRILNNATIKVTFGAERHLEPFDRTKEQQWRGKTISTDMINLDKVLRMEVQWELSEILFRYELYALDQAILPRDQMTVEEHRQRNGLLSRVYLGATDGTAAVVPNLTKPIKEYWGEHLNHDSVDAFRQVLKRWPNCPNRFRLEADVEPRDFSVMVDFYVQTFVQFFCRIPSMHCNTPVSLR